MIGDMPSETISKIHLVDLAGRLVYYTAFKVAEHSFAVSEYMSFAKLWQETGCCSQAETWKVGNILMKDFE